MTHSFELAALPVAHRGLHAKGTERVENTLASFEAAIDHGFATELDVQLTADGEAVVFHDFTLERLTGSTGKVIDKSSAALSQIQIAGTQQPIMTLHQVMEVIDGRAPVFIELKGESKHLSPLSQAVALTLSDYSGPCAVMSFDHRLVSDLATLLPHTPRGLVFMSFKEYKKQHFFKRLTHSFALHAPLLRLDFMAYDQSGLPAMAPSLWKKALNIPLLSWTVTSKERQEFIQPFVDQIIFEQFIPQ